MRRRPPKSTRFPYTALFQSERPQARRVVDVAGAVCRRQEELARHAVGERALARAGLAGERYVDRKSTRPNSSHAKLSYGVFCLTKTYLRSSVRAHRGSIGRP